MKVITQLKLETAPQQANALKRTLEAASAAAHDIRDHAWDAKTLRHYNVHERFNQAAQVTVRIIAKVSGAYMLDRKRRRIFKPLGSMADDTRSLLLAGQRQLKWLQSLQGQAELIYRASAFYRHQISQMKTPDPYDPEGWLGVHLGSGTITTPSDGDV